MSGIKRCIKSKSDKKVVSDMCYYMGDMGLRVLFVISNLFVICDMLYLFIEALNRICKFCQPIKR